MSPRIPHDEHDRKRCSVCHKHKDLDQFGPRKKKWDGLKCSCHACETGAQRARYERDPEKHRAAARTHRNEHIEEARARRMAFYYANKDKERAYSRKWDKAHRAERNTYQKRRYADNPERFKQALRQNYQRHRKKRIAWAKAYHQRNPDIRYKAASTYRRKNLGKYVVYEQNRRARELANGGTYTVAEWEALKAYHDFTCLCCGKREPDIKLTADHIVPVTKGGMNTVENLQPLCQPCNSAKNNRIIDYRPKSKRSLHTQQTLW